MDTIEGNPILRAAVSRRYLFNPKHLFTALLVASAVAVGLVYAPAAWCPALLGYVWGLFLIVDTTHIGNLIGYKVCQRGTHGQLWLHQRTAFLVQAGRYAALTVLLALLAIVSASPFVAGTAVAGISSVLRQYAWLRRVPAIPAEDKPPPEAGKSEPNKALQATDAAPGS